MTRRAFLGAVAAMPFARGRAWARQRALRVVGPSQVQFRHPARAGFFLRNLEIGETLIDVTPDGRLVPGLAAEPVMSTDNLVWRCAIRAGATFHDGEPVTADAVVIALNRARAVAAAPLHQAPITLLRAEDDHVAIRLSRPFTLLPAYLATSSAVILAPRAYADDASVREAIGSGPYRLVRISDNIVVEIEATRDSDKGGPAVQAVVYRAVADGDTRARMLESGDAEIAQTLLPVAAERLRRNPRINVVRTASPRLRYIMANAADPRLADVRVREALSLAIDRDGAARAILRRPQAAASQLMPPVVPGWTLPGEAPLRHDPAAARQLLDDAGWRPGRDGIRARGGERLTFELLTYTMRPEMPSLAEALQAQWRAVGIDVRIEIVPPERIVERSRGGTLQLALVARSYMVVPDIAGTLAEDFVEAAPARGWGAVGWTSPEIEAAIDRYAASDDDTVRADARATILRIIHRDLPIIPHSWYDHVLAHTTSVAGVVADPFEASYRLSRIQWA